MKKTSLSRQGAYVLAVFLLLLTSTATPATAQEVLSTDLSPLIDQAARSSTRFAVDVPHTVSADNAGSWVNDGARSTWTYSIRIPTAVSMSFHASQLNLPGDAVLTVTGKSGASLTYRARDIVRGGLWSRPLAGDSLFLSLSLSAAQRSQTALRIESFQAGYRSLGGNVPDNAHYRRLKAQAGQTSSCVVNYSCQATNTNQGPANATVAIVVGNLTQCTGTLVNDTSGDGIPYVLTARHCENGVLGGGAPGAAASVTVYWDAVTPCGTTLGSIYDGNAVTQTGATTMVEQQDAWLIKLDAPPAAHDAYYAGWDATGGTFSGGYSIHHALGYNKQYAGWYGQPVLQTIPGTTLKLGYPSTFWGVVNETGSIGAGASGGALFDPNNNVVGSATMADLVSGDNSAGICPAIPPPTPSPSTATASYTALSAVWASTVDTTASTGGATLKSVLDAANTGNLVVAGVGRLAVTLSVDQGSPGTGQTLNLTWNAPGAQACTASGGMDGDGWAGSRVASGNYALTEQSAGQVTYSIRCTAAGQIGGAAVTVDWQFVPVAVNVTGSGPTAAAGRMVLLQWAANTAPCTASGGISGDGWAGTKASSGSQSVQASVLGNVTYSLTCGTGGRTATGQYTINVVAPSVGQIYGDANQMLPGQPVNLQFAGGGSCVASGGAAGDGWAGPLSTSSLDSGVLGYTLPVTETVAGTYTYTVTCSGVGATANLSSSNSITLTFTGSQPTASLTASPTPVEIYTDPGATASVLNLAWTSNVRPCNITYAGPGGQAGTVTGLNMSAPAGTTLDDQEVAGSYVYTVTCGTGQTQTQSTASVVWFTNAPAVTLNVPSSWPLNSPTSIGWQSNVYPCTGTGGLTGDGWAGSKAKAAGYQAVTESTTGAVTFGITCGTGSQTAQAQASTTVITPSVSVTASASSLAVNGILLIQWTANTGPCSSSISPGGGNFGTVLNTSGGFQTTQLVAGTYTYTVNCAGVQASTQVTFTGSLTTLTASATAVSVGTPITLSWSSPSNTTSCTASGGSSGDGWTGSVSTGGTKNVTSRSASTVTYTIDCDFGYGPSQAQAQVTYAAVNASEPTVPTPTATLTASTTTGVVGTPVTLSWTSENASACTASGGASGDGWSGSLSLSGSMSIKEASAGSFTYGIVCSGAPPAASASTDVAFSASSVTVTGNSGGGGKSGGGGTMDPWGVLLLGLLMYRQLRRGHGNSGHRLPHVNHAPAASSTRATRA
jgi:hypothetical protein